MGAAARHPIACDSANRYIPPMPAFIFWVLVVAAVALYHITTKSQRSKAIETFWAIIFLVGIAGFALQFLLYGSISF